MLWNMGGTGAGIGCNSGESCSVSGSGNITATLRWVYNDADTSTAPNPPAKIALLESANAGWTGWIDNPISGAADPSQIQSLSVSGSADDGENDVFQESISGGTIIGQDTGVHYSVVDSSSGTVTKSASMSSSGTASISSSTSDVGYISPIYTYTVSLTTIHAHPTNVRLSTTTTPNWKDMTCGTLRFWYDWDSDSGSLTDLGNCTMYELVSYSGDGTTSNGKFYAANPPFDNWIFNNPTRVSGPANTGHQIDDVMRGGSGSFNVPTNYYMGSGWTIKGMQHMRFHCNTCGADELIPGPDNLNQITRSFMWVDTYEFCHQADRRWIYKATKHGHTAWLMMNSTTWLSDSSGSLPPP